MDQGEVVERTTRTVFRNLIEGALLVIAVLFLFLRSARASLLTASVIPLSLLGAFGRRYMRGRRRSAAAAASN